MNIEEKQKRRSTITISLVTVIVIIILATAVYFIIRTLGTSFQNPAIQVAVIAVVGAAGTGFLSFFLAYLQWQSAKRREKSSTRDISTMLVIEEASSADGTIGQLHKREAEKLDLMKQQVQVQEKQLDLEKEKLSLEWQKEAVMAADISPQAAIIIAWAGIELEIQRAIEQLVASSEQAVKKSIWPPLRGSLMSIELLSEYNRIDIGTAKTLKEMLGLRNKVAHAGSEGEKISNAVAVDYVQKAISIAQKISSSQN